MRRLFLVLICGVTSLLGACAGAPSRYYSLDGPMDQAPGAASGLPATPSYGLRLQVLRIPADADRPQLLVRDAASDPAVQVLNDSLWAGPLADQIQTVLAARVAASLGVPDLQRLPGARDRPVRQIEVRVTRFDLLWNQGADLAAVWTDRLPGTAQALICQARIRVPAASGIPALVDAQRQAVWSLAALMAEDRASGAHGLPTGSGNAQYGCT
ncbi:MAG: PqiC family protein [Castellaniella sp.]|nr:PqiC family protein [Castellaniella sp.]